MATRDNGATKFETVRYEPKGAICHIILNRPEKLNAITPEIGRQYVAAPAAPSARAPTSASASSVRAMSSSASGAPPAGARARTGSPIPSTGSR